MNHSAFHRGRPSALAPAAALLLALCLLAVGVQAVTDPADTAALVTGAGEVARAAADLPVLAEANTTSTLVISEPGRYELDHDLVSSDAIGVLINSSDVLFDGMGHSITGTGANGSIGVYATGPSFTPITNVTVRNLTVRHWADGIRIGDASDTVVEDVVDYLPLALPNGTPPVGGDRAYFLVSTAPAGAAISLEDISGTRYLQGTTTAGPLNVTIMLTATPMRKIVATLSGYRDAVYNITQYPAKDQTVPVSLTLDPVGPTPYRPLSVPGRIQAEDYNLGGQNVAYIDTTPGNTGGAYRQDDVDIETGNGITNVGWIRDGESLKYTVNVAQTGYYIMSVRVASPNNNRFVEFSVDDGRTISMLVPNTGSFETYATTNIGMTHDEPIPTVTMTPTPQATGRGPWPIPARFEAGTHVITLRFLGDGQNLDWFELAPVATPTPTPVVSAPYKPLSVPGTIQAEDYDLGGEGVAYHDTTKGNSGGAYRQDDVDIETAGGVTNVGWIRDGEWLTYTATIAQAGTYTMTASVASPNSGRAVRVQVDGVTAATIAIPNTGSFAAFRTVSVPVSLEAGSHVLKLAFSGDGQNLDRLEFAAPVPAPELYANVTVPGTIQAENYDLGGEGVAYHDATPGNSGGAYRQDDVDVAAIAGGGHAVVGIEDGEWLAYTIDGATPTPELPALVLYLASDRDGGSVQVEVNGRVAGNVSVPNTGSSTAFRPVQTQFVAAEGTLRLLFRGGDMGMDRIESPQFVSWADAYPRPNFTVDPANGTAPLEVRFTDTSSEYAYDWRWTFGDGAGSTEQNPVHTFQRPGVYNVSLNVREADRWIGGSYLHIWNDLSHGKTVQVTAEGTGPAAHAIPGTIQAEDYDAGGEGVTYHDTTPGNSGGAYRQEDVDIETAGGITNVGWIRNGEYLTYTAAVQDAGAYALSVRVASPNTGRSFDLSIDGVHTRTIVVPNTGSFGRFATVSPTVSVPVTLAAGTHTLKLTFQGDGQNLDWIAFGAPPTPTVTSTPTPTPEAGGASFTAAPVTAPKGSAVKFTLVLAAGKTVRSAWWSFDATAHLNTWNSRAISPTFFYPAAGTFTPLVKITYTDGSTETVQRANYVRAT